MQAIILAAGRGSRLGGLTDRCPKCLVELENRPLLAWQIEVLREAGISEIVVVSGYRSNLIVDYANSYHFIARHNFRRRETNMLSTLFSVEDLIKGPCIVSYSDIIYDVQITKALMDQSVIAGVGNYIKSDSLWLAGISPKRTAEELSDLELSALNRSIKHVMKESYQAGGATIDTYKDFNGENGENDDYGRKFLVYNQDTDPDGNVIERIWWPNGI